MRSVHMETPITMNFGSAPEDAPAGRESGPFGSLISPSRPSDFCGQRFERESFRLVHQLERSPE